MTYKFAHFSGYTVTGPSINYDSPASGASDDWAYGMLGTASMTWEIGTTFHQDCFRFENSILDENLSALTYASKLTSKPYHLSKGPDIVSTAVTTPTSPDAISIMTSHTTIVYTNQDITLTVTASDSDFSAGTNFETTKQKISEIIIHVNVHPYHNTGGNGSTTSSQQQEGEQNNDNIFASPTWRLTKSKSFDSMALKIISREPWVEKPTYRIF